VSTANRRVKRWPGWVALVLVVVGLFAVGVTRDPGPQTEGDRIDGIARRIACPICDGESVYESRNRASTNIRNRITTLVDEGRLSDDEIIADLRRTYDEKILLVPQASGTDALVWALPVAAFVAAAAGLTIAFARWRAASALEGAPSEADRQLVAEALERFDGDASSVPSGPDGSVALGATERNAAARGVPER
jgi:cytochrome c-type biogenesis protein CcmH